MKNKLMNRYKLEEQLFMYVLLFISFICLISIAGNLAIGYEFGVNYKWIATLGLALLGVYLSCKKKYPDKIQLFFYLGVVFCLFPAGGPNNFTVAYLFLICITINYLFIGKTRHFFNASLIVVFFLLLLLQERLPSLFPTFTKEQNYQDMMVQVPVTLLVAAFMLQKFAEAYRNERKKLEDYSELLHQQNKLLERLAITDELTQLYNRRHLFQKLEEYRQAKQKIVVLIMDIDNFKQINDEYGHETGDRI